MTQPNTTETPSPPPSRPGYPIVALDTLKPATSRTRFWRKSAAQSRADAVPYALTHEVVVLRVGRKLVRADDGTPGDRERNLADAISYCVVDMTRERPVVMEMQVPSEGGLQEFTLRVTFACTVRDPLRIAESGLRDMQEILLAYVKSCDGIQYLGMEYGIAAVRNAYRRFRSTMEAYAKASPPIFAGMLVELTAVEVLTPAEILEEQRRDEVLRRQREKERALKEENIAAQSHIEKLQEQLHQQRIAFDQERRILEREFGWRMRYSEAEEKRRHDQRQRSFDIDESLRLHEAIGNDPGKLEAMARIQEGLSSYDHLVRSDERERRRQEEDGEERRWERDREVIRAESDRDDQRAKAQWDRRKQDEARQRAQELEDKEAAARLELLRIFVERGHSDRGSMLEHVQRLTEQLTSRGRPGQRAEHMEFAREDTQPALQDTPPSDAPWHAEDDRPARLKEEDIGD